MESNSSNSDKLKYSAFHLSLDRGLSALSARSLADFTGGNSSEINYYFGSRSVLISEIFDVSANESEKIRAAVLTEFVERAPPWADFPFLFAAALQGRLERGRSVLILLQELELEATSGREPTLLPKARAEIRAEFDFWRELSASHGASPLAAEIWASVALGLMSLLLDEQDPCVRSAWITEPAVRLSQRLRGEAFIGASCEEVDVSANIASPNKTALAILNAALSVIAQDGPDRLSQRKVAATAGVSLALVTKLFRTKRDLITAAFLELYRQGATMAENLLSGAGPDSDRLLSLLDTRGLFETAMLSALFQAAARDAELKPIAERVRAMRGVVTTVLLAKRGLNVDRLDGYLWACTIVGKHRCAAILPDGGSELLATAARKYIPAIFSPNHSDVENSSTVF